MTGARKGNRNAAKYLLPPQRVLDAYVRLVKHGWITISKAASELQIPPSTFRARVTRSAPTGDDTDLRSQWLLEQKAKAVKANPRADAERLKRERLRAELEGMR